ncbi:phosphoesterase [Paractinoplanes deccanensis]|uniref:Phosphoesterase n=1 Tax=Paractinoplanes deccanensis TaxID=113561 RepID=A0ABQ3XWA2_9ACTN|nr:bifunctional oligoribonuclease/PAP phosphatase NrnA [Actinoplanes deccanensis]GID72028.1 phosphoesterase [Actinoplanes deccanensis]
MTAVSSIPGGMAPGGVPRPASAWSFGGAAPVSDGLDRAPAVIGGVADLEWAAAVDAIRALGPDDEVQLICHVNPDGDALGSMLGFALGLRRLGLTRLRATFPGDFDVPEPYKGLPGSDLLVPEHEAYRAPALVLIFDVAAESRLGALVELLPVAPVVIVLDHHASNTGFGGINLVAPRAAATSVVAEALLTRLGVPLDAEIAECLYVALSTDTGSFKFDLTTPEVHELAARLIATGISPAEISRRIFDTRPFGAMKLSGEVLGRARLDAGAAGGRGLVWTWATQADLERHAQKPYVLESLIDPVRSVAEADVAVLVKEMKAGEWAVSLRSKGAVDVSKVAVALGGGGHRLAAGFTGHGSPEEVVQQVKDLLEGALTQ